MNVPAAGTRPDASPPAGDADTSEGRYISEDGRTDDELSAVLTVSQALAGALDLDHVLGVAVRVAADRVAGEGASILLIDPDTGRMSFHVAAGPGADAARTVPLPAGAGVCGHVARTGEPLVVNDAAGDPRLFRRVDAKTGIATRNLLCVPLRTEQRMWGVLEVINKRDGAEFTSHDLRLAEAIAAPIALGLENAHLHGEIVRTTRMAAVGETVSGLAHCVKNVLNGIRSGSATVDRALADDDHDGVRDGWAAVRRNNGMLSALVLDMLSLAKETRFHPFPTDVNDLAEQVAGLCAQRGEADGISVSFEPAPDLPDVLTDPTQLYRCLLNLVSNAVEACEAGGRVRVRVCCRPERERVTVSVLDSGAGISPANRDKLFREFFTTKGSRGTGLGLPVTHKLITAMGGAVTFHSVVGRGTKFVLALPTAPPETDPQETTS